MLFRAPELLLEALVQSFVVGVHRVDEGRSAHGRSRGGASRDDGGGHKWSEKTPVVRGYLEATSSYLEPPGYLERASACGPWTAETTATVAG